MIREISCDGCDGIMSVSIVTIVGKQVCVRSVRRFMAVCESAGVSERGAASLLLFVLQKLSPAAVWASSVSPPSDSCLGAQTLPVPVSWVPHVSACSVGVTTGI